MTHIRHLLLSLFLLFGLLASAQIEVLDCQPDPNSPTAISDRVIDADGNICSVVVVNNVGEGGFKFEGAYRTVFAQSPDGETYYKVYVSPGTQRITIKHNEYDTTGCVYKFPNIVQEKQVYVMYLKPIRQKAVGGSKQYLIIEVSPEDATVEVNGDPWEVNNGIASRSVHAGSYQIRVSAPEYHTDVAMVQFNAKERRKEKISLKPNFGHLTISGDSHVEGASVYIDGVKKGTGNIANLRLPSGSHEIKIAKEMYRTFSQTVNIQDGRLLTLQVTMLPNFAKSTVTCSDAQAEIWRDGELLGKGTWVGTLELGDYLFETKRDNHSTEQKTVHVTDSNKPVNITLAAPVPITGILDVQSDPYGMEISIDGTRRGTTPYTFNNLIIGSHRIDLSKPGYKPINCTVTIAEGQTVTLSERASATTSAPKPKVPRKSGKKSSHYCIYGGVGGSGPAIWGVDLEFGTYLHGFNLQADWNIGCKKSKEFNFGGSADNYIYNCFDLGLRIGYGINIGKHLRLSPQAGINGLNIYSNKGTEDRHNGLKNAWGLVGTGGIRFDIPVNKLFVISVTPEYRFKLSPTHISDLVAEMVQLDKTVKHWFNGFNIKISLSFYKHFD